MGDVLLILALILGGLLLIFAEICTPAFGILAISALVCFGYMVYRCFVISPVLAIVAIVALMVGLPFYLVYLIRLFPKTPIGKRLMLRKQEPATGEGVPESVHHAELIGTEGVTSSVLRPSGTVTLNGRRMVATAEMGYIADDTPVRVVRSSGLNLVVRALDTPSDGQDA